MGKRKLKKVIVAWAEPAAGPGWTNTPVWYIHRTEAGGLVMDCLQPEEQSWEIATLYGISSAAHSAFLNAVEAKVDGRGE